MVALLTINVVGLGQFVRADKTSLPAYANSQQTAIGFMVKYNDKKVIKLRDENGGKFEREFCAFHPDRYLLTTSKLRCASLTQSTLRPSCLSRFFGMDGLLAHPFIGSCHALPSFHLALD